MRAVSVPPRPAWMDEAVCAGIGSDWWYPQTRQDGASTFADRAKRICATCPVQVECLEYALDIRDAYGIWGGLTAAERRKISREPPLTADVPGRLG